MLFIACDPARIWGWGASAREAQAMARQHGSGTALTVWPATERLVRACERLGGDRVAWHYPCGVADLPEEDSTDRPIYHAIKIEERRNRQRFGAIAPPHRAAEP